MRFLLIGLLFMVGCNSSSETKTTGQRGKVIIDRIQTDTDIYYKDDSGECFRYNGKLIDCEEIFK